MLLAASTTIACAEDDDAAEERKAPVQASEPGPVHVHGLGVNPADDSLFIATHTGLFRAPPGDRRATRVADRFQDTMGFTVVGPNRFLGSGHPDGREDLPPFLGLIRSTDAGSSWEPVSLLGKRDFHVLEASGDRIYGYGSEFATRRSGLLASDDGGRSWRERTAPEPLVSLAIDPTKPDRILASGQNRVHRSNDGGRSWTGLAAPAGLLAWTRQPVLVGASGSAYVLEGDRLRAVGRVGGGPAALEGMPGGDLYVALHDGTVKRSTDGGLSWRLRSAP